MNKTTIKTLEILSYVGAAKRPVSLKQISEGLNISAGSSYNIINTMLQMKYLQLANKDTKTYSIGIKAFEVGFSYIKEVDLLHIAKPFLKKMSLKSYATAFLAVPNGNSIVYLDKVEGIGSVVTTAQLGSSKGMYYTGLGKAILATIPTAEVENMYKDTPFIAQTANTICDMESLKKDLFAIRQRGYAIDDCEGERSLYCIASPIRNYEGVTIAAISIANFKDKIEERFNHENVQLLLESALEISRKMGYTNKDLFYQK